MDSDLWPDLLARAQSGDAIAYRRFLSEVPGFLRAIVARTGVPNEAIEDVVQETFLALYRHLLEGRPRDCLHGWIFKVARNIALKRLQRMASSVCQSELLPIADPAADPEQRAVRVQQGRAIQNAIAALPDFDRQCLCLRAEGLRYRDIAAALEVSLGSVALALSRTLTKLARVAQK